MPLAVIEPPQSPAVDLEMLKKHLNMEGVSQFDGYLQALIAAVAIPAARAKGQTFIKASYQWTIAGFSPMIALPRPPLISVSKVEYRAADGLWREVAAANYEVNSDAKPGFVRFAGTYEAPGTYEDEEFPWRFTYSAGYVDDSGASTYAAVPANLRLWMMNLIGSQFMKREADMIANGSVDVQYLAQAMGRLTRGENHNRRFG